MNVYDQLIARLFTVNRQGGCKLGLHTMERLDARLGFPSRAFASIQVAGTNGKGSVTTKIAKALQFAGYKVGCYTSPHLSSFRERIQVNGVLISEQEVETYLTSIDDFTPTFFELTTALAFLHFARSEVEFAVLETGLGGRLDATNIVTPCLSVITSISLEHVDILGCSREAIAREKAGIIKQGIPTIVGPMADLPVIREIALDRESLLISVPTAEGDFDAENCAIASAALTHLAQNRAIDPNAIEQGLLCRPPCRFERVPNTIPEIVLDVGHNPNAILRLKETFQQHFPDRTCHIVCGFSKDKDVSACLEILASWATDLGFIQANHERAMPLSMLNQLAQGIPSKSFPSIKRALEWTCDRAAVMGGVVLVCGSFFIMSEVRACLGYREPRDRFPLNEGSLTGLLDGHHRLGQVPENG